MTSFIKKPYSALLRILVRLPLTMGKLVKYYTLFFLIIFCVSHVEAQYLCPNEYKIIRKQKKKVKKKVFMKAKEWILDNRNDLNLPRKLKLSKLKFKADEKEIKVIDRYNKWQKIDSLLCVNKDPENINMAKMLLLEFELVVFDIRAEFNFDDSSNKEIKSVLNFEFDFDGDLIRAVIRKKKMSPFSETPLH